jgi:hypothetical protein
MIVTQRLNQLAAAPKKIRLVTDMSENNETSDKLLIAVCDRRSPKLSARNEIFSAQPLIVSHLIGFAPKWLSLSSDD